MIIAKSCDFIPGLTDANDSDKDPKIKVTNEIKTIFVNILMSI